MGAALVFVTFVPGRFLDIQRVNMMKAQVNKLRIEQALAGGSGQ
jgi:hypothetical protein